MKNFNFIYKTTNLINGKIYVGLHTTDNLDDGYLGSGVIMLKAIKKHGEENFKREIIEFCITKEKLENREIFWIKDLNAINEGYNIVRGGNTTIGYKHTEKYKKERSLLMLGSKNKMFGKTHTEEALLKIKNRVNKQIIDGEHPSGKKGKDNHMYGRKGESHHLFGKGGTFKDKKHTEETKKKMSENNAMKNPEYRKRVSEGWNKVKIVTCPHCGKEGKSSGCMYKWHFDNCKLKK